MNIASSNTTSAAQQDLQSQEPIKIEKLKVVYRSAENYFVYPSEFAVSEDSLVTGGLYTCIAMAIHHRGKNALSHLFPLNPAVDIANAIDQEFGHFGEIIPVTLVNYFKENSNPNKLRTSRNCDQAFKLCKTKLNIQYASDVTGNSMIYLQKDGKLNIVA